MNAWDFFNALHWALLPFGPLILIAIFGTMIAMSLNLILKFIKRFTK